MKWLRSTVPCDPNMIKINNIYSILASLSIKWHGGTNHILKTIFHQVMWLVSKLWFDHILVKLFQKLFGKRCYLSCPCKKGTSITWSQLVQKSFQFSPSVVSDALWPHGLQHDRLPCPLPTLGACSNSCPSSWWCHPTISPSVVPFSSCLQSFPASGSFPMSQFVTSGGQSIWAWAWASVLPMNIQDWSLLEWTGWISLQFNGLSRVFSDTTVQKHQFFGAQLSL